MVCPRCIRVVKEDLEKHGVVVNDVKLGFASISFDDDNITMSKIRKLLKDTRKNIPKLKVSKTKDTDGIILKSKLNNGS